MYLDHLEALNIGDKYILNLIYNLFIVGSIIADWMVWARKWRMIEFWGQSEKQKSASLLAQCLIHTDDWELQISSLWKESGNHWPISTSRVKLLHFESGTKINISWFAKFAAKEKLYEVQNLYNCILFTKIFADCRVCSLWKGKKKGLNSHPGRDVCCILEISVCLE